MRKLLIISAACLIASCTSTEKLLCRTWKVDDVQFVDNGAGYNKLMAEAIANELKSNVTFTFARDSVYQVSSNGNISTNKWWLSKDHKSFWAIGGDGSAVSYKIEKLKSGYFKVYFPPIAGSSGYILTCSPVAK